MKQNENLYYEVRILLSPKHLLQKVVHFDLINSHKERKYQKERKLKKKKLLWTRIINSNCISISQLNSFLGCGLTLLNLFEIA